MSAATGYVVSMGSFLENVALVMVERSLDGYLFLKYSI